MEHFKQNLTGGLRRLAMAGVGAITLTVDKSREIIDQLASRGEVTAAEGQAACDELHKKLAEQVSAFTLLFEGVKDIRNEDTIRFTEANGEIIEMNPISVKFMRGLDGQPKYTKVVL